MRVSVVLLRAGILLLPASVSGVSLDGRFRTDAKAAFQNLGVSSSDLALVERIPISQRRTSSFFEVLGRGTAAESLKFDSRELPPLLVSTLQSSGLSSEPILAGDVSRALAQPQFVSTLSAQLDGVGPVGSPRRTEFWKSVDEAVERKVVSVSGGLGEGGTSPVSLPGAGTHGGDAQGFRPVTSGYGSGSTDALSPYASGFPVGFGSLGGYSPGMAIPTYGSLGYGRGFGGYGGYGGYGNGYINIFDPYFLATLPAVQRFNDLKQRAEFFLASAKALRLSSGFGFASFGRGSRGVRGGGRAQVKAKPAPAAP